MTTPAVRLWYALLVSFIAAVVIAGVSMQYANHVARESERKWCRILTSLDEGYRERPPATQAGQRQATEIHALVREFGCGK